MDGHRAPGRMAARARHRDPRRGAGDARPALPRGTQCSARPSDRRRPDGHAVQGHGPRRHRLAARSGIRERMMKKINRLALAAALLSAAPLAAAEPITGSWVTATRDGVVRIAPCGKSLCGTLARFLVTPPGGADQRDVHNPDARLRNRKLLGLPILTGFAEDGAVWRG